MNHVDPKVFQIGAVLCVSTSPQSSASVVAYDIERHSANYTLELLMPERNVNFSESIPILRVEVEAFHEP